MTNKELRTEIIRLCVEMSKYPEEGRVGVYIKRSIVNGTACNWAAKLKRLIDKFDPPKDRL